MADTSKVSLFCSKTTLSEKFDPGALATVRTHPIFTVKIEFDESRKKKTFKCPHCSEEVGYKAFRWEFNLRKALKWPGILTGIGPVLFLTSVFLMMGGLSIDQVGWLAIGGFILFVCGLTWLLAQSMRYFSSYRKNKTRYVFRLSGIISNHRLPALLLGGSWKSLPPTIT